MNYLITSARITGWQVRLEDTDAEHARSVFEQLKEDPAVPDDLMMGEEEDPTVTVEEPVMVATTKRSFRRRILRRA